MLERLAARPYLFSTLKMNTPRSDVGDLLADLRVRASHVGVASAFGEIFSVRVVHSLGWNPDQHLYFEATRGSVTLTRIDDQTLRVRGDGIPGFYRRPVMNPAHLLGDGDFREAPAFAATLDLSLLLHLTAPNEFVLKVGGFLSIQSAALAPDLGGAQRIDATVTAGETRLFPRDLPAQDAAGQLHVYFLEILPVLVQGSASVTFNSPARLLRGAGTVWQSCPIRLEAGRPFTLQVDDAVIQRLRAGDTIPLREIIRQQVPRDRGVPVAFVEPLFAQGGGEASDHGPERAIVVVTEQSQGNDTLLAHELGHVLGGKEAGSPQTADYWVGESDTIMDGSGDVTIPAPGVTGPFACENARRFARWRSVP